MIIVRYCKRFSNLSMKSILLVCVLAGCAVRSTAQYNFYFGNIHSHTAYSDGSKDNSNATPASSYQYAKGAYHMDFLGVAEHNHFSSTNNPGMHVADYARGLHQADTSNRNGYFVCMFGMEYGVISNGGHLIVYGVPGLIGWETGSGGWGASDNYDIYNGKYNYGSLWATVNGFPNAFATLAHPQDNDYNGLLENGYDLSADNAVVGCAIRSGDAFSTTNDYSDGPATLYQNRYFLALSKGYHLGPTIDHDNHYTTFGRTSHSRTVVLAQSLDRDSIMAAYKAMRFYASDDWDAHVTFLANGHMMGESDTTPGSTQLSVSISDPSNNTGGTDGTNKIELYYGRPGSGALPTVLASAGAGNTLTYWHTTNANDSFYYFVKITQTDGDIIWTAPIWLKTIKSASASVFAGASFSATATLDVHPNPGMGMIIFSLDAATACEVEVRIYSIEGREVYNVPAQLAPGTNTMPLDIRDLPAGGYVLVVSEANRRIGEARFIKQ